MPLDNYITRPDFSRQIKQYPSTIATLSGQTNILEKFSVKNIEIDTAGASEGDALIYDAISNKYSPNTPGSLGSRVIGGLLLSYESGLTYNVSEGTFRISSILYGYTGGTVDIVSGLTSGSRFDVVYITSAATPLVSAGTTSINPFIPQLNISGGELQIGIIFVPANFTGGTGSTVIQSTGTTFEFNNATASAGIQRQGSVGAAATGDYSFASNYESKATGNYSSAIGYYAEATGTSQTVVGQYNTPDEGFFIVGNGTAPGSRSNAFRVTTGGSAYIQNKLFVSSYEIETTGATNGQALVYDSTLSKFRPQNVTGATGGSGSTSGTSLGDGVKVLFSSDTTSLSFATLSSQTPSTLRIVSSSTGVILFSATTGSGGGSGSTSGTSLGDGIKVLFSSDTSNLAFATLSSQTPSILNIISSSTGVILFSASNIFSSVTINEFSSNSITLISGYNAYSNPAELNLLISDDLGSQEKDFDIYQLNYFTEKMVNPINPLVRGQYSAFTGTNDFGTWTGISFTVGRESYFRATGITSGDTIIGTIFRNRFVTKNYNAANNEDNSGKNIVGTAFFNQTDSNKFNLGPFVGTLMETHLLGSQQATFHNEVRNLQLGFFNRGWVYRTNVERLIDLHINRPILNAPGFNAFNNTGYFLSAVTHAAIFIDSRTKLEDKDVLSRPLNTDTTYRPFQFRHTPWSLFAESDRAYIGNTLVLASAQTLTSTTRGAWLDIGASQTTKPHINLSAGTAPTSPQIGDLWWNGTELYFRQDSATTVNLLRNSLTSKNINVTTNFIIPLGGDYLYDKIILTSSTPSVTITSITVNSSISSFTPSIRFFAESDLTVTFQNSDIIKTEGGLNAIISGSTYDNITFEYNPTSQKFYQTNINNYI